MNRCHDSNGALSTTIQNVIVDDHACQKIHVCKLDYQHDGLCECPCGYQWQKNFKE